MNAIEIRGLSKSFRSLYAVDGLNMTVPVGAIYGFIGENGSGLHIRFRGFQKRLREESFYRSREKDRLRGVKDYSLLPWSGLHGVGIRCRLYDRRSGCGAAL